MINTKILKLVNNLHNEYKALDDTVINSFFKTVKKLLKDYGNNSKADNIYLIKMVSGDYDLGISLNQDLYLLFDLIADL